MKVSSQSHTSLRRVDYTPGHWTNNWTSTYPFQTKAKLTGNPAPSLTSHPLPRSIRRCPAWVPGLSPQNLQRTRATFWLQWWRGGGGSHCLVSWQLLLCFLPKVPEEVRFVTSAFTLCCSITDYHQKHCLGAAGGIRVVWKLPPSGWGCQLK